MTVCRVSAELHGRLHYSRKWHTPARLSEPGNSAQHFTWEVHGPRGTVCPRSWSRSLWIESGIIISIHAGKRIAHHESILIWDFCRFCLLILHINKGKSLFLHYWFLKKLTKKWLEFQLKHFRDWHFLQCNLNICSPLCSRGATTTPARTGGTQQQQQHVFLRTRLSHSEAL